MIRPKPPIFNTHADLDTRNPDLDIRGKTALHLDDNQDMLGMKVDDFLRDMWAGGTTQPDPDIREITVVRPHLGDMIDIPLISTAVLVSSMPPPPPPPPKRLVLLLSNLSLVGSFLLFLIFSCTYIILAGPYY
jgi:hypothetical protein